jgi:hypothetical protein
MGGAMHPSASFGYSRDETDFSHFGAPPFFR